MSKTTAVGAVIVDPAWSDTAGNSVPSVGALRCRPSFGFARISVANPQAFSLAVP